MPQDSFLSLFSSYTHSFGYLFQPYDFKDHLYGDVSQIYISSQNLSLSSRIEDSSIC